MTPRRHFIPPDILDNIERNGSEAQKARARKSRALTERLKAKREEGQHATEPQAGEIREIRDSEGSTKDDGPVVRAEDSPDTGDLYIDDVYNANGIAFSFLHTVFGRNGPDGNLGRMLSLIHYSEDPNVGMDNAAYYRDRRLGMVMVVGDGDIFPPFHLSPGVSFHEWGHAFTEATCGLGYGNTDIGGNNEGGSDILSALTEQWWRGQVAGAASWLIAPELFTAGLHGRALRDMLRRGKAYSDPLLGDDPQIDDASQYRRGQDPHITSAVPNRWFAEACMQFPDRHSWETIGPVWYDAWTKYMTPVSGFGVMAKSTIRAATERYGATSPELSAVQHGWDVVKVETGGPLPEPAPGESPCALTDAEVLALIRNPEVQQALRQVARLPQVRRFVAAARLNPRNA